MESAQRIISIEGNHLTLDEFKKVACEFHPVQLADSARSRVLESRAVVDHLVKENRLAYAITTGVGKLSDVRIDASQNRELQINLIRSHSVGIGEPLSSDETRAIM